VFDAAGDLEAEATNIREEVPDEAWQSLDRFDEVTGAYNSGETSYMVGNREVPVKTTNQTIEGIDIPRVSLPDTQDWGDRLEWIRSENVPGSFPFAGGVFPFKRTDEMPMRMFAGEGSSTTTNQRFHYLTKDLPFKRLSTAFDSITLYGLDATDERLDLWAKCCESGVSVSNIDEMERLFEGFDLCSPNTSVSLTINGNYWGILAMFLQTAIRQQNRLFIEHNGKEPNKQEVVEIKARALSSVRGTVQADQLKEQMAQSTLIIHLNNSLRMMSDVAEYFVENDIGRFNTVSISGYHIDEAGSNAITQAALTLSNGLTYLEIFKERGLDPDEFLVNFSWFFSCGIPFR
jgi:methylmalonyl-CoA mutase